ncbi:polysaccharide deacetylase [Halorubrum luteum]
MDETNTSDAWPDGYRSAAVFTFDLDATETWDLRAESDSAWDKPPVRTRGEFGPNVAVPRILELFERYDRRCTFFIPGKIAEDWPETVQAIHDAGHEIGLHGYRHINPARLSPEEEENELIRSIEVFEDLIGERPIGYRSPAGDFSDNSFDILARNEIIYDSSLKDDDLPYPLDHEGRIVELPDTWYLDDWPYFGFHMYPQLPYQSGISPTEPVFDTWRREFFGLYKRGRLFNLIMHPQIIGRAGRMDALEELLQDVVQTGDTWITSVGDIAEYWQEVHM